MPRSPDGLLTGGDAAQSRLPLDDGLVVRERARIAPRKPLPPVEPFSVEGYAISDFPDPDRAGNWVTCPRPRCHNAAYFVLVYPTEREARLAVQARAAEFARALLPSRRNPLELLLAHGPLEFFLHRLHAVDVIGRDYRIHDCAIPGAAGELRSGLGHERAWREVRRQRDADRIEGVLLPGPSKCGQLFLFRSALHRIVEHTVIDRIVYT